MAKSPDSANRVSPSREAPEAHLTARQAVALLGVRLPTLYAYVSRGLVHSIPGPRGKQRLYSRADLERLKARHDARAGHAAVAVAALRWGEPVLDSHITRIDASGPWYRGRLATALASDDVAFESVAELLWRDESPSSSAPRWRADGFGCAADKLAASLPGRGEEASPLHRLAITLPALAARDRARSDQSVAVECERARTLLVRMRAALALGSATRRRPSLEAESMARGILEAMGRRALPDAERLVNRCLVLCADHELNASAFAARIAASAGADLYACIGAALAVLSGERHGGVTEHVEALVAEVGSPARAREVVESKRDRGESVPGFGHPLYPDGDPRASALLAWTRVPARCPRAAEVLFALVDAMRGIGREAPTLDVGLVAVARVLELPAGAPGALFAIGRAAGWVAHALEQRRAGYLLRPRARYVGR
jgi:citrate synthase